ncbi:ac transposable element-derived 4 [Paramuricea clavata]|uniref:Ac transposable element-derived 4 n=1 Tax=Paramuricea clavata TaxID=317549 RepID=A0A6S7HCP1_PARCT|nr:ac transposable element-derived 4 [Paramuricea clavata]
MQQALCPPDEDPSVYKWELENILSKADPTLSNDAKTALLTRQFLRGLPPTLQMLEHNPPTPNEMVEFTQRFCALGQPVVDDIPPMQVDAVAHSSSPADPKLQQLIYHGCWHLGETTSTREPPETYGKRYTCGLSGHLAQDCMRQQGFSPRRMITCYNC